MSDAAQTDSTSAPAPASTGEGQAAPDFDRQALAEKVLALLKEELRVERERRGRTRRVPRRAAR